MKSNMQKCILIRNYTHLKCAVGLNLSATISVCSTTLATINQQSVNNTYSSVYRPSSKDRQIGLDVQKRREFHTNTYSRATYCVINSIIIYCINVFAKWRQLCVDSRIWCRVGVVAVFCVLMEECRLGIVEVKMGFFDRTPLWRDMES